MSDYIITKICKISKAQEQYLKDNSISFSKFVRHYLNKARGSDKN